MTHADNVKEIYFLYDSASLNYVTPFRNKLTEAFRE